MSTENNDDWYKKRHYLHFDPPIGKRKAISIATNPKNVSNHAFYPLIKFVVNKIKVRPDDSGRLVKHEKPRPIAYASHSDAAIYSYYSQILSREYEKKIATLNLNDNILAFRSLGKSNIHFANDAFEAINRLGPCTAIGYDVSKFFDTLDHGVLKSQWQKILGVETLPIDHYKVFKSLTNFTQVDKREVFEVLGLSIHNPKVQNKRLCSPEEFREFVRGCGLISKNPRPDKGIPQGTPISALLSNIYMLEFDHMVKKTLEGNGGVYYRYCDDMLFVIPDAARQLVAAIDEFVTDTIKSLKIEINQEKTEKRQFILKGKDLYSDKPLQYLGFLFDGKRKMLRSAGLAKYSERMKRAVTLAKRTRKVRNKKRIDGGLLATPLYKRKLYSKHSYLGRRNFITYALRAAEVMESNSIRKQIKPLWKRLQNEIKK
ncbi:MAG: RNA-directed DNA polymerase [Psychroserpens sp.]